MAQLRVEYVSKWVSNLRCDENVVWYFLPTLKSLTAATSQFIPHKLSIDTDFKSDSYLKDFYVSRFKLVILPRNKKKYYLTNS